MSLSPNMNLPVPVPQTTPGPLYAQNEVDCFAAIDLHDHTSGKGVQVPTAGININADLALNGTNLTGIRSLRLNSTTAAGSSDLGVVFRQNNELCYRDFNGNTVVITNNGSVAGATGSITGLVSPASASFSTGTFFFSADSSKPAKIVSSDLIVSEFGNATANPITIKSPAALSAAYTLTLPPTLPAAASLTTLSASGGLASAVATTHNGTLNVTGGVQSGGANGPMKWEVFTGSGSFINQVFTVSGTIIGASGNATYGGNRWPIPIIPNNTTPSGVYFSGMTSASSIRIDVNNNVTGSFTAYSVVVFYI